MDNETFKHIADQLRKPEGEMGKQVGEKMNSSNELINQWTIASLDVQPHDNILEIGMGNGFFVKQLTAIAPWVKYTGVDYSKTMIEEAAKINELLIRDNRAHFILADALTLPLMSHSFDKMFTINTVYFWQDAVKQLNECKRVLKEEGMLVIAIRPQSVMKDYPFAKYGFKLFSKETLSDLMIDNGFVILDIIERDEPTQGINGKIVKTASLIIVSRKKM